MRREATDLLDTLTPTLQRNLLEALVERAMPEELAEIIARAKTTADQQEIASRVRTGNYVNTGYRQAGVW